MTQADLLLANNNEKPDSFVYSTSVHVLTAKQRCIFGLVVGLSESPGSWPLQRMGVVSSPLGVSMSYISVIWYSSTKQNSLITLCMLINYLHVDCQNLGSVPK